MGPATLAVPHVSKVSDDHLDALQDLGDEIATLAAHIHAAKHRFLTLIAEFDRLRGWEPGGHRSCAHGTPRILDVGRKTRTIPPALRRALESRDRGCRFPGCGLRFTDAHHVRHWADGGETKLENLVLLCRFHHRLVHEEGYTVHFPRSGRSNARGGSNARVGSSARGGPSARSQRLYFLDPQMRGIPDEPPPTPPLPTEPVEALRNENSVRGVEPDYSTAAARYKREADIPWPVFARALEALEEAAVESEAA